MRNLTNNGIVRNAWYPSSQWPSLWTKKLRHATPSPVSGAHAPSLGFLSSDILDHLESYQGPSKPWGGDAPDVKDVTSGDLGYVWDRKWR